MADLQYTLQIEAVYTEGARRELERMLAVVLYPQGEIVDGYTEFEESGRPTISTVLIRLYDDAVSFPLLEDVLQSGILPIGSKLLLGDEVVLSIDSLSVITVVPNKPIHLSEQRWHRLVEKVKDEFSSICILGDYLWEETTNLKEMYFYVADVPLVMDSLHKILHKAMILDDLTITVHQGELRVHEYYWDQIIRAYSNFLQTSSEEVMKGKGMAPSEWKKLVTFYPVMPEEIIFFLSHVNGTEMKIPDTDLNYPFFSADQGRLVFSLVSAKTMIETQTEHQSWIEQLFTSKEVQISPHISKRRKGSGFCMIGRSSDTTLENALFIDFEPNRSGTVGQVVAYDATERTLSVAASSLKEYLNDNLNVGFIFSMSEYLEADNEEGFQGSPMYSILQSDGVQGIMGELTAGSGLVYVLLDTNDFDVEQFVKDYNYRWDANIKRHPADASGDSPAFIIGTEEGEFDVRQSFLVGEVHNTNIIVGHLAFPLPHGVEAATNNYRWPEAVSIAETHKGHVMIGVIFGQLSALDKGVLLSTLVETALQQPSALGVIVHDFFFSKDEYLSEAELIREGEVPAANLIAVHMRKHGDGVCIYTEGMKQFGQLELEDECYVGDELERARANILYYAECLLREEKTVQEGTIIGYEFGEHQKVHIGESIALENEEVIKIQLK